MVSSLQLYKKVQKNVSKALHMTGMPAALRRVAGDRPCTVVVAEFTANERQGSLLDPLDMKALISTKGLTIPPSQEDDMLVTFVPGTNPRQESGKYRITSHPTPVAPGGVVLMWQMAVRRY